MAAGVHLQAEQLNALVAGFLWPLFRIAAFVGAAPVLGARTVPARVKVAVAVVLTLVLYPLLPPVPALDPLSGAAVLVVAHQVLVGAAMGLVLQMVFNIFVLGGQVIAYQMGLGFASMVDPASGTQVPVVSQFYVLMATLVFFALGGHLALVQWLLDSFRDLPVGAGGLGGDGLWALVLWGGGLYAGAVRVALPAIGAILVLNLTFGVVTRAAPQFNVFSIGFPVTLLMGFVVMLATLGVVLPKVGDFLAAGLALGRRVLGG